MCYIIAGHFENNMYIDKPKFNGLKNPESPKLLVSGNMPRQNHSWAQPRGKAQLL
jgi:hypothetical protein